MGLTFDVTYLCMQPFDELAGAGLPFTCQTVHSGTGLCELDKECLQLDLLVWMHKRSVDLHENVLVQLL